LRKLGLGPWRCSCVTENTRVERQYGDAGEEESLDDLGPLSMFPTLRSNRPVTTTRESKD
jgi:hypothetical protein